MDDWKMDFINAQARLPHWLSHLIRPRLIFLPGWWLNPLGAWAYLHLVFIGPGLVDAPLAVRRYIIGHEYGHIQSNHTILHFVYWCAVLCFLAAVVEQMPVLGISSCLLLTISLSLILQPHLARKREYQADKIAALVFGPEVALQGALWMADKTGMMNDEFRCARLEHLGWKR